MRIKGPRMGEWIFITVLLLIGIYLIKPEQLPVVLHKLSLVTLSAPVAYFIDRSLYKRVRDRIDPDMPRDMFSSARLLTRSIIFMAVVLGVTLGL